ncbi:MAG TPA: cytochrome c oxidase subunit II, partial [Chitinivibrionales bacterium]
MSTTTAVVDGALIFILAISALLFFLNVFFMVFCVVRYRRSRNPVPQELHGSALIEIVWVVIPTLLVSLMFLYGLTGFRFFRAVPPDSLIIKVYARQWSWLFEYGGGKKSPDLIVPMGKNICCELISQDVIHGFYIPAYRIQQDIVPGLKGRVWFNAITPGSAYILCSQYCGLKHSAMLAKVIAVPPDQFDAWMHGKKINLVGDAYANMPAGEALLYQRGCISCHSLSGEKMVGPTFKGLFGATIAVMTGGAQHAVVADSAYIMKSIVDPGADVAVGFPNTMPPVGNTLSNGEIRQVIDYL